MAHFSDWMIGIDLGDRKSTFFAMHRQSGEIVESEFEMTEPAVREHFEDWERCRVVFEVGGHSRWVKRVLSAMGFKVMVADPRRIALVTKSVSKNDRNDARRLAELATADLRSTRLELLNPVEHRDDQLQADLAILKSRDLLVTTRTKLVNAVRGFVKSFGSRLRSCSTPCFHRLKDEVPASLTQALHPLFDQLALLTKQIRAYDRKIEQVQQERYPEASVMLEIRGVGALTAMAFRLTLGEHQRFGRSRSAAAFVGLCPKQHESGTLRKELGITKCGDRFLRRLLVHSAHYILGPFGEDCDLRRWGERLAARGGRGAKKRAAVAVARKLAVLLHRLWADQTEYERLRHCEMRPAS